MNNKEIKTVLVKTKKLLKNPNKWNKGSLTKSKYGKRECLHRNAVKWCLAGAIDRFIGGKGGKDFSRTAEKRLEVLSFIQDNVIAPRYFNYFSAVFFNDKLSTTHKELMSVLDKAIKLSSKTIKV